MSKKHKYRLYCNLTTNTVIRSHIKTVPWLIYIGQNANNGPNGFSLTHGIQHMNQHLLMNALLHNLFTNTSLALECALTPEYFINYLIYIQYT